MIDFTNCEINKFKYYGGKNGGKFCVKYLGEDYMVKFPGMNKGNISMSYSNNCISEYVVCHIMETLGLKVQKTLLGTYKIGNKEKVVVACKDFTNQGIILKQFAELKNSQIETSENGYGTELEEILETIESQEIYDVNKLKDFFWDMFIADSLVGNFDRHNGNWGFLIDEGAEKIEIAPIYDNASCLYPQLDDATMENIMKNKEEMEARVYVFPTSAIKINDKKINYFEFIGSLENEECNKALKRIYQLIDIKKINKIIENTPYISNVRKEFYKKIINLRYEKIIKYSYEKLYSKMKK